MGTVVCDNRGYQPHGSQMVLLTVLNVHNSSLKIRQLLCYVLGNDY